MQINRLDDFGESELVEISTINKKVCLFFIRKARVFREAFTKEEAIAIGKELIKQGESND